MEECWCRGVSRLKRGLSACGQLEVVSDLCQKQTLRRARIRVFIFSPSRAHIIYKPSRRESERTRACSRGSSERRRDLPQSGCYQTDNTHTHQLSFWPPAALTEKRSQLSARCCALLVMHQQFTHSSHCDQNAPRAHRAETPFACFQLFISGANCTYKLQGRFYVYGEYNFVFDLSQLVDFLRPHLTANNLILG